MQVDRHRRSKTAKVVLGRFCNSLDGLLTIALGVGMEIQLMHAWIMNTCNYSLCGYQQRE
jgi:hypothetical protein